MFDVSVMRRYGNAFSINNNDGDVVGGEAGPSASAAASVDGTAPDGLSPRMLKQMVLGGVIAAFFSVAVDSILYMASVKKFFAIIYAVVISVCSFFLFVKASYITGGTTSMKMVLRAGAIASAASSVSAIILPFTELSAGPNTVFLMSLGSGCAYALGFVSCDIYNKTARQGSEFSARQVHVLALVTLALGAFTGFVFGVADVEHFPDRFGWQLWLEVFLGFCGGLVISYVNATAVDESMLITFDPLPMDDEPDDARRAPMRH